MPLLVFVKFYCIDAMAVVSEKSCFGPCYSNFHVFKNAKKCCFFFGFNSFGRQVGFGFCGLILSFAAVRECNSFFLFFKQQVSRLFFIITITHAHTCLLKNVRFHIIFGAFEE